MYRKSPFQSYRRRIYHAIPVYCSICYDFYEVEADRFDFLFRLKEWLYYLIVLM